jgi:hypothetical protein
MWPELRIPLKTVISKIIEYFVPITQLKKQTLGQILTIPKASSASKMLDSWEGQTFYSE